ncbi:MAG: hypothetical protein ACJ73S_10010 [Mycobacteriales bacterium]
MQVTYCRRWNFLRNRPIDPLTEQQARERDRKGELYTAALGVPTDPAVIVEVERPSIRVKFLDRFQRVSNSFDFRRYDDKMFLHHITNWAYPDDEFRRIDQSSVIKSVEYELPDLAHLRIRDKVANEVTGRSYREVDLSSHWEPVPEFGDWLSIARYDRDKPVEEQFWAHLLGDGSVSG